MKTNSIKKDKIKHYCFHRDYRHVSNDCQTLKDEIEFLLRKGCLEQYIRPEQNGHPCKPY